MHVGVGCGPALRLSGLRKRFGRTTAVAGVELSVPRGSCYGLVGPRGAGKTTVLAMAAGLVPPDEGTAEVFGADVRADPERARSAVGLVPDLVALPERPAGRELLYWLGRLCGEDGPAAEARARGLLDLLELGGAERASAAADEPGLRKRMGLAIALLYAPRLLLLDEPFDAVDQRSAAVMGAVLARFVASGGSVLFSSAVTAPVERLCDHVAVMIGGSVVASGPMTDVGGGGHGFAHTVAELSGEGWGSPRVPPAEPQQRSWLRPDTSNASPFN
ncbi:ATP-binding cassette domain-containing protein [Kitasatospora sp. NPDC001660]